MRARRGRLLVAGLGVAALLIHLRDPFWMGGVTVGLRDWEQADGVRYRWATGRASFFVPTSAAAMTLPMRAVYPGIGGAPVSVDISVDGRALATIRLTDPDRWVSSELPLEHSPSTRHFRRIDLHVSRMVGFGNRGVQVGEVQLTEPLSQ